MRRMLIAAMTILPLAGCVDNGGYGAAPGEIGVNKTTGGALIGAAGGGLLGSQFGKGSGSVATTAIGVVLGGLLGSQIGASLDRADQAALNQSTQQALESAPTGRPIEWRNPDSGHYGEITPTRTYQEPSGTYCREYQQNVVIGGQSQQAFGTACRQPDGSWRVVSQ
ncbi:MAG TPA: RT0821/Lpp0805 family surface protein [Stellaceae bacterium]|nr:RT0821/Lpp0805 family surface protein [Stellaceae bacterium]